MRIRLKEVLRLDVEGLQLDLFLNLYFLRGRLWWLWRSLYDDVLLQEPTHLAHIIQDLFEDLLHVLEAVS